MILRLYTGTDGKSHFEEMNVPQGESETIAIDGAAGATFRRSPAGNFSDFHPTPNRRLTVYVSGQGEIGVGDGTVRRLGPGDVLISEDLTGQGHTARTVGEEPRVLLTVLLA